MVAARRNDCGTRKRMRMWTTGRQTDARCWSQRAMRPAGRGTFFCYALTAATVSPCRCCKRASMNAGLGFLQTADGLRITRTNQGETKYMCGRFRPSTVSGNYQSVAVPSQYGPTMARSCFIVAPPWLP